MQTILRRTIDKQFLSNTLNRLKAVRLFLVNHLGRFPVFEIRTNNQKRELLYFFELSENDQNNVEREYSEMNKDEEQFFKYKGYWYALSDFSHIPNDHQISKLGWHGMLTIYNSMNLVVKLSNSREWVTVGRMTAE